MRQSIVERWLVGGGLHMILSSLQLECARVLHESFLVPVLIYDSETLI